MYATTSPRQTCLCTPAQRPGTSHKTPKLARLDLVSPFLYTGPGTGTNSSGLLDSFGLQGIKGGDSDGSYLITGTSSSWTVMNVPSGFNASSTSLYGVANLDGNNVNLVGSYVSSVADADGQFPRIGSYYTGAITSSPNAANFQSYRTYALTANKALPKAMRKEAKVTHFDGTYKLPATVTGQDSGKKVAAFATVKRKANGSFGKARWSVLDIPGTSLATNDSLFGDANVGVAIYSGPAGASDYAGVVL